jgi:L,D-transpeptidase YcbB
MRDRMTQWGWLVGLTVLMAACAGERELATEHIRLTLNGAPPAAVEGPSDGPAEGTDTTALPGDPGEGVESGSERGGSPPVVELPNGDTLHIRDVVVDFYRAREYEPAWTDHSELSRDGAQLLAALGSVDYDGLDPHRYGFRTAQEMASVLAEGEAGDRRLEYLGNLDMLLTESFVRATLDVERGLLDPHAAGLEWLIERSEPTDSAVVERLSAGDDPHGILASARPSAPYYHRLAAGLKRLRTVALGGGWPAVPAGETLRPGDRDRRVALLRARLLAGEDQEEARLAASGQSDGEYFDDDLEAAVRRFQLRHTLHEDGAFGPSTLAALNVPVEDRIETVRLNLDRWRWLPDELGAEYLLVNVAGFELELVASDSVIESMSVVVGRTANRTPLFRDTLEYVVVNPYWNVPISIVREDIVPEFRRDPGYLDRNRFEVLSGQRAVRSSSVTPADLESGRYMVRQLPGPENALGNVKFLFPNDMNIYLHDTPAGHLFTQEARAFSAGCIRLERPDDLARTLLDRLTDHDGSYYDELRRRDGEQWITVDRQIPIYILYFTAWSNGDGSLRFHPDIYERDQALAAEREAKLPPAQVTRSSSPTRTAE